jgi:hypothetical protein
MHALPCRTQRLQDLQLLNLRYKGTSFLCVPVVGGLEAGESAGAEAPAADASMVGWRAGARPGAIPAAPAKAAPATVALGCLTLGFPHDVRRHLPE